MPTPADGSLKILAVCHEPHGDVGVARTRLANELKSSPGFCKYFQSVWLIATKESPSQLWKRIEATVPKEDYVLIIDMKDDFGTLPKAAWDWIESVRNANKAGKKTG